ncbi:MAG: hypothetical protein ACK2UR_11505 [Candidatus Promineifilaceae bacterium]|jgi:tryptophan 2,3-dioxygenase
MQLQVAMHIYDQGDEVLFIINNFASEWFLKQTTRALLLAVKSHRVRDKQVFKSPRLF